KDVGQKLTPAIIFTLKGFTPVGDTTTADFSKCGNLSELKMRYTLFLTENALWRLRQFLNHLGIEEGDRSLSERLSEIANKPVLVTIRHEWPKNKKDATGPFATISETAKATF